MAGPGGITRQRPPRPGETPEPGSTPEPDSTRPGPWRSSGRDLGIAVGVMAWIGAVLLLDGVPSNVLAGMARDVSPTGASTLPGLPVAGVAALSIAGLSGIELLRQLLLGAGTWAVLIRLLHRESVLVRTQTLVVVALATGVEYTFSPLLQAYVYRIGTVPFFVPPGHGLVYLGALALGRSPLVRTYQRTLVGVVVLVGGGWAVWGWAASGRPDQLGAFWFACLLGFLAWGPSRPVYLGAFVVVSYLELLGTALGTWAWAVSDPVLHVIGQGNPPSGAAGGYGWFDLYALLASPRLVAALRRWRRDGMVGGERAHPVKDG